MPQMAPMVEKYIAEWDGVAHKGKITVIANGNWYPLELDDPNEFSTIVDILRNEKPIFFKEKFRLLTHQEDVGEGET